MRREEIAAKLLYASQLLFGGDLDKASVLVREASEALSYWRRNVCAHDGCKRERELYSRHCKEHGQTNEPPV